VAHGPGETTNLRRGIRDASTADADARARAGRPSVRRQKRTRNRTRTAESRVVRAPNYKPCYVTRGAWRVVCVVRGAWCVVRGA